MGSLAPYQPSCPWAQGNPHSQACPGQMSPPPPTATCPHRVSWQSPKCSGETRLPVLPSWWGMLGEAPCPASGHARCAAFAPRWWRL